MKIAFSTLSCPDWTWRDLLDFGPQNGYDGVEIRLVARETDLLKVAEFQPAARGQRRRELADAGFAVCGLASSVRFDYPDAGRRQEQIGIGRAYVDLAADLGASFVRVFGDVVPDEPAARKTAIEQIAEGLQSLGEYAAASEISIVIETHGDFSDSQLTAETLARVESPAVGVLWDTHHPWRFAGEPLDATCERLRPWIRHTHWKDSVSEPRRQQAESSEVRSAADQASELMSGHRHADYVLFGDGEFPAQQCASLLAGAGYDGWFSLEWEKMWHPEIEDPEVALPLFPERMRRLWASQFS